MRLFVSIDLPDRVAEEIRQMLPLLDGWRKAPVEQYHVTLFFIGECSEQEYTDISHRLDEISFHPFRLVVDRFGVFPDTDHPTLLWAGFNKSDELINLQKTVLSRLTGFGHKRNVNFFIPHVTVARRKKGMYKRDTVIKELLNLEFSKIGFEVRQFSLKESIMKPEGSEHIIRKTVYAIR